MMIKRTEHCATLLDIGLTVILLLLVLKRRTRCMVNHQLSSSSSLFISKWRRWVLGRLWKSQAITRGKRKRTPTSSYASTLIWLQLFHHFVIQFFWCSYSLFLYDAPTALNNNKFIHRRCPLERRGDACVCFLRRALRRAKCDSWHSIQDDPYAVFTFY